MKAVLPFIALLSLGLLSACGGSGGDGEPPKATLTVAPAALELFAGRDTPATLTVTNTSGSIAVTAVSALLPAGWTDVVQDAGDCATLPPQSSCTLAFTASGSAHAQASVSIRGHGADNATVTIVVNPPHEAATIEQLTSTQITMPWGGSAIMQFINQSATITALNISARLDGTALNGHVTQDTTNCAVVPPGSVCSIMFHTGNTSVSTTAFPIRGDNTNTIGGSLAIVAPTTAQLAVAGSPLVLQATAGTPTPGALTITNLSTVVTATNIHAELAGSALDGNLVQDAGDCTVLAPGASCTLEFTPGASGVGLTTFNIQGDNTSVVGASIAIDAPQATLAVAGSPLELIVSGTTGVLTITNTSLDTATDIASNFTGTTLDGNVTETANTCATLAPGASCTLTFTPGSTVVPATTFTIAGSNTNTAVADMTIRTLALGDEFGGGIVLALPSGGTPGLIVASGTAPVAAWGSVGVAMGASSTTDGQANTTAIVNAPAAEGSEAAAGCDQLSTGGYTDWFLPASAQLQTVITAAAGLSPDPDLFLSTYWSSTELDLFSATIVTASGFSLFSIKDVGHSVRCVREFTL